MCFNLLKYILFASFFTTEVCFFFFFLFTSSSHGNASRSEVGELFAGLNSQMSGLAFPYSIHLRSTRKQGIISKASMAAIVMYTEAV